MTELDSLTSDPTFRQIIRDVGNCENVDSAVLDAVGEKPFLAYSEMPEALNSHLDFFKFLYFFIFPF